jgi:molybdenum cofactor cytidylyltransferase
MAKLAGIVLAAGTSSRFGLDNKLLAPFAGEALIARAVARVRDGVGREIIVVTGEDAAAVTRAVTALGARVVLNPDWQQGIGGSIATGVGALADDVEAAFIVPGDMPFLQPGMLRAMTAAYTEADGEKIVYPATVSGEQRNPVLWPRRYFAELKALSGGRGAKDVLAVNMQDAIALTCCEEFAFTDVDTPADLAGALDLAAKSATLR